MLTIWFLELSFSKVPLFTLYYLNIIVLFVRYLVLASHYSMSTDLLSEPVALDKPGDKDTSKDMTLSSYLFASMSFTSS